MVSIERKLRVVWSCDDQIAELYSFVCSFNGWEDDFDRSESEPAIVYVY